ncbi:MAG: polysaccharide pyruvyl transferase family protein [Clostridia bacterium]|nr:polysaccharide pyruvyl transferase family protein [Clostridia bacterium]
MARKIGIITIHNALNYGSTLQAIGLQEYLSSEGLDCKIIDYQNEKINSVYNRNMNLTKAIRLALSGHIRSAYCFFKNMILWRKQSVYGKILKPYDRFRKKNLRLTKPIFPNNICFLNNFDAIIAGSDQIWSEIVGDDTAYYLDLPNYKGIRIAYAASGTVNSVTSNIELIKHFNYISVREKMLQNTLCSLGITKVSLVCDPTLLCDIHFWGKYVKKSKSKTDYIFAYLMFEKPQIRSYIAYLEKKLGLPVVVLNRAEPFVILEGKKIPASTPKDFLSLLGNAKYVVTNSFHGTVFSALFQKNFVSYICDYRIVSLLDDLGLSARMVHHNEESTFDITQPIDWLDVNQKIERFRDESKQFIKNCLDFS